MAQWANIQTDYFARTRIWSTRGITQYLNLWALVNDHFHRATGIGPYSDELASDEMGIPIEEVSAAREFLVAEGKWIVAGRWMWMVKRGLHELLTTKGGPNVKMCGSARKFIRGTVLPPEIADGFLTLYGDIIKDPKGDPTIPYGRGIQLGVLGEKPPSGTDPGSGTVTEPSLPPSPPRRSDVCTGGESGTEQLQNPDPCSNPWVEAFCLAMAKAGTPGYHAVQADFDSVGAWHKKHPDVGEDQFAEVLSDLWTLGRYCPSSAMTIRGACGTWTSLLAKWNAEFATKKAFEAEVEKVARQMNAKEIEDAKRKLADRQRHPFHDAAQQANFVKHDQGKVDLLLKPDAWKRHLTEARNRVKRR